MLFIHYLVIPLKMSHPFVQNCCRITLQVSHHQGWKTLVSKWKVKLIFRGPWNGLMAWPDWPWPSPLFYDRSTALCGWYGKHRFGVALAMHGSRPLKSGRLAVRNMDLFAFISSHILNMAWIEIMLSVIWPILLNISPLLRQKLFPSAAGLQLIPNHQSKLFGLYTLRCTYSQLNHFLF